MTLRIAEFDFNLSQRLRLDASRSSLRHVASLLAHSGDSWLWFLGLTALYILGNAEWQHRAYMLGLGIMAAAMVVFCLKYTIRRKRPESDWGRLYRFTDPHSFPSGHAARGAVLAAIALWIGPPWLAAVILAWAPLLGLVRIMLGVHYLLDVLVGFAVGALTGVLVILLQ
jgi:undecaprenyl-diphosphatase